MTVRLTVIPGVPEGDKDKNYAGPFETAIVGDDALPIEAGEILLSDRIYLLSGRPGRIKDVTGKGEV